MGRSTAEFSAAFSRDPKKKVHRRNWDLVDLQSRHNMHRLSGSWAGRSECHVANSGDWLVIWSSNDSVAFFERTGSHDELFR